MSEAELDALAKDIKQKRLRQCVALWSPGKPGDGERMYVLDGINRLDALERNGIKFMTDDGRPDLNGRYFICLYERRIITVRGVCKGDEPDVEPWDYVISVNIQRRHLSAEDKRDLIAKVLKAKPEQSNRQIAQQLKVDHKTVATVRAKGEATGEIPQLEKTTGADGKSRPKKVPETARKATDTTEAKNAHKPRGGIQTKDDTLRWFTTTICELLRKTDKQKPERFTATIVGADDLTKLGAFLNDIAELKATRVGSVEISTEEMSAKFAALDVAQG
jgi:hypothetical protein